MSYNLKGLSGLVVTDHDGNRKMLTNILKVLGIKDPQFATDVVMGFRIFREGKFDFVLSEIKDGRNDVIALADFIRKDERSPNPMVPIISLTGPATKHHVDVARNAGVTEMIMAPYTVSDIGQMIAYVMTESSKRDQIKTGKYTGPDRRRRQDPGFTGPFRRDGDELLKQSVERAQAMQTEAQKKAEQGAVKQPPKEMDWVSEGESQDLTKMLLENYLKHHEIVFSKLKFAQEATKQSLDHIRKTYEDVKNHDATNILEFKNFDQMWEQIIAMFVQGGLSEDEIFKIEDIITTIPPDIKQHYSDLTAQDKTFLTLVESMNVSAYKKAKAKVSELQAQPNIMSGMTRDEYQDVINKDNEEKRGSGETKAAAVKASSPPPKKPEPKKDDKVLRYDSDGNLIR
ncbi:MAG: hypothetical protein H6858_02120 [Rhodospirillales bacterium]|nr:hypothetical protein [Alphaproteobacteria bacterium]MCB9976380.1 hypothetical protein [Rhodospirillales bacterium]